jgi:Domain of unknown function (DUF1929)/Glyoxal oxidase N-terminus/Galactose oxidase, central domain
LAGTMLLALPACAIDTADPQTSEDELQSATGKWAPPVDLPVYAVHASLLPTTGNVLFYSGDAQIGLPLESFVWDPSTGKTTRQTFDENLFCSGLSLLDDGRVFVIGGAEDLGVGMASAHIFDPATSKWTKKATMRMPRWYPTANKLADGRILATSGRGGESSIEVYDPKTDQWKIVDGIKHTFDEYYPSLHLLPTGELFNSGTGWEQKRAAPTGLVKLTSATRGSWKDFGQQQFPDRQEGAAVLSIDTTTSPPKTVVMVIGGGLGDSRNTVETTDLTSLAAPAVWKRAADMHFGRTNVSAVVLPNGTTLAIGGQTKGKKEKEPGVVLTPELYNPVTNVWTKLAVMKKPRQYHSVAVLLPDGRVIAAGGINPAIASDKERAGDQFNMEIYSPPYLFNGKRPSVTSAPASAIYGATIDVGIDVPAADIASVTLVSPQAVTHHTDGDQRFVRLKVLGAVGGKLQVAVPANGNIAPPGFYMLFAVNQRGVPSIAKIIHLAK